MASWVWQKTLVLQRLLRRLIIVRMQNRFFLVLAFLVLGLFLLDRFYPCPLPKSNAGIIVLAEDGTPLRTYPDDQGIWRYAVDPDQVSQHYLQALLGYEDRVFWWHPGVNPWALLRAALQWLEYGRVISGGSTLTMQVARILEPQSRSLLGKLRQIMRALQLELHFSKREILTMYLNYAPMGGIVQGVEMAARSYLGKSAKYLSHSEAALLAALPQAPSRFRPDRWPERAQIARNKVIERMAKQGLWGPKDVADARSEMVMVMSLRSQWLAPIAAERVRQGVLSGNFGSLRRNTGEQTPVYTTIDGHIQSVLERMLLDRVGSLPPRVSMAAIVLENQDLQIRAYAGSADFTDHARAAHVDMVRAVRSPGSTLKPFLYALALDEGMIHSESLLVDAPQSFGGYQPGNFQSNFTGPVSVSEALQRSLNVPAVDLLDRLGVDYFASILRVGGIRLRMPAGESPNLSLILGGAGTTLEELVGAYRALAAGGLAGRPRLSLSEPKTEARMMSAGAAYIVRDILKSRHEFGGAFSEEAGQIAWKTGTSFGFRDAWSIGVSDQYTVGVWIGRPDGSPNPGFFGANVAAPLVRDVFSVLVPDNHRVFGESLPQTVGSRHICWPLGLAVEDTLPEHCHVLRRAWVLQNSIPPTLPDRKRAAGLQEVIWVDPVTKLRVSPGCVAGANQQVIARWPFDLEPWMDTPLLRLFKMPEDSPRCQSMKKSTAHLTVNGVFDASTVMPAAGHSSLTLKLYTTGHNGKFWWLFNGRQIAVSKGRQPIDLHLTTNGVQQLTVLSDEGSFTSLRFTVKGLPEAKLAPRS